MRRDIDLLPISAKRLHPLAHFRPLERPSTRRTSGLERDQKALEQGAASGHGWRGASSRLYYFSTSALRACRAPPRAIYVLVRRDETGRAVGAFIGMAISRAPTTNLARIRERAAILGATEVHLMDMTHLQGSHGVRRMVRDLRAGLRHAAAQV